MVTCNFQELAGQISWNYLNLDLHHQSQVSKVFSRIPAYIYSSCSVLWTVAVAVWCGHLQLHSNQDVYEKRLLTVYCSSYFFFSVSVSDIGFLAVMVVSKLFSLFQWLFSMKLAVHASINQSINQSVHAYMYIIYVFLHHSFSWLVIISWHCVVTF